MFPAIWYLYKYVGRVKVYKHDFIMKKIILKEDKFRMMMRQMIDESYCNLSDHGDYYGKTELDHIGLYEAICCDKKVQYDDAKEEEIYNWCDELLNGVEVEARYYLGDLEVDIYGVKDGIISDIDKCDLLDDEDKQNARNYIEKMFDDLETDYEEAFDWDEFTETDYYELNMD